MWAADGALLRLRLPGGRIRGDRLAALVPIVERFATNGVLVTRRAKLELRGVEAPTAATAALDAAGWLETPTHERVPDIVVSGTPVCGGEATDARTLGHRLHDALAARPPETSLADKFLIAIDAGGVLGVAAVHADIRLDRLGARDWRIAVGGTRATATPVARVHGDADAAGCAAQLVRGVAERFGTQRLRTLTPAERTALTAELLGPLPAHIERPLAESDRFIGYDPALGHVLSFVFGHVPAAALALLAAAAGPDEIAVLPDRRLVVPELSAGRCRELRTLGAIVTVADPRAGLAACVGRAGCAQATTDTRGDALALAHAMPEMASAGLHVSGCRKGCAGRRASPVTLTARDGRYDVIRDGPPDGVVEAQGLTRSQVCTWLSRNDQSGERR
ncbi:hypothetical protein [Salinisphaera sp. Q1T1-3]|uniref:hypothetical protein n=1 Tax=Salinisphaera sp. Q1T1-3 TaxID=2321229 RepID=UPI0013143185|nr:hypothetical protein [Salinisphaera sp. Q1T1-3]